jgi:hypothetical protein
MRLTVSVEFLVGKGGTAGQGMLGSLEDQGVLEFLVAEGGRVLKGQTCFGKCPVGDAEDELAIFGLFVDYPVGIIPAMRFQLKSEILDLHEDFVPEVEVPARATRKRRARAGGLRGS